MIEIIQDLKYMLLESMDKDVQERGSIDRIDPDMTDMLKDLCEAEYYCAVTEAMNGGSGYPMDMGYRRGYENGAYNGSRGSQGYRSGWANQYGRGYTRMGHTDPMEDLRNLMMSMSPDERERMKQEMQNM